MFVNVSSLTPTGLLSSSNPQDTGALRNQNYKPPCQKANICSSAIASFLRKSLSETQNKRSRCIEVDCCLHYINMHVPASTNKCLRVQCRYSQRLGHSGRLDSSFLTRFPAILDWHGHPYEGHSPRLYVRSSSFSETSIHYYIETVPSAQGRT